MTNDAKTGTVDINGTKLYYELRGRGPSLFFIPGAEGDAEEYLRVVERLDNDFTVLSYDRRAYSRSPRPAGRVHWQHRGRRRRRGSSQGFGTGPGDCVGQ